MEKVRVYELAKELNTTSKRLMEKLGEINIQVKNHMSLLEEDELNALYKHIGVIKREDKAGDAEEKKPEVGNTAACACTAKQGVKRNAKSAPRIIRTTEIIINTQDDSADSSRYDRQKGDVRGNRNRQRNEYVTATDANSGLLSGFVRKTKSDYATVNNSVKKASAAKNEKLEANKKEAAAAGTSKKVAASKTEAAKPEVNKADLDKTGTVKENKPVNTETVIAKKDDKPIMHDDKVKVKDTGKAKNEKKQDAVLEQSSQPASEKTDAQDVKRANADVGAGKATMVQDNKPQQVEQVQPERQKEAEKQEVKRPESRPQGDKPSYLGNRPQGTRSSYQGNKPQGGRSSYQGNRPQVTGLRGTDPDSRRQAISGQQTPGRAGYRQGNKPLDIPMPELTAIQKEELGLRSENRREFISKDVDKGAKREQRKEAQSCKPEKLAEGTGHQVSICLQRRAFRKYSRRLYFK